MCPLTTYLTFIPIFFFFFTIVDAEILIKTAETRDSSLKAGNRTSTDNSVAIAEGASEIKKINKCHFLFYKYTQRTMQFAPFLSL